MGQHSVDKQKKLVAIFSILLITISFLLSIVIADQSNEISSFEMDQHSQKIGHGPTEFKIYKNQVYVSVPSNGEYLIPEADPQTIRTLGESYAERQIAVDKNHVYCGNLILDGLQPDRIRSIGDGYVTDGQVSYYCSQSSKLNDDLKGLTRIWHILRFNAGYGRKPQNYLYPSAKLVAGAPYKLIEDRVVSNGENTYNRGKLIKQSKGGALRYLQSFSESGGNTYKSSNYTADGQHVYYQDQLIPIQDQQKLVTFNFGAGPESEFLYDPSKQNFYYHQIAFPAEYAPYQILNHDNEHAHDPLFYSQQGIWFYNREKKQVQKVGENPFKDQLIQLAPDVFHNGHDTYFLGTFDQYIRSGKGSKNCYRSTVLYRLDHTPLSQWKKVNDVRYGGGTWHSGTVWQNGTRNYYFDTFGSGQGFNQSIYLIKDKAALKILMNPSQTTDEIRSYIRKGLLLKPEAKKVIKAKYDQSFCLSTWWSDDE